MPAFWVSSFSGIRPTERSTVSQENSFSVPGISLKEESIWAIVTPVTLSFPWTQDMLWLKKRGIP